YCVYSGGERLVCRVTSPRRFPSPNHATGFKLFLGKEKTVEDSLSITRKPTGCEVGQVRLGPSCRPNGCNPFRVDDSAGDVPSVAAASQRWADRWNPVGIQSRTLSLVSNAMLIFTIFWQLRAPSGSLDRKLRRVARLAFHCFALYQTRSAVGSAGNSKLSRKC